jgi:glycogen operon protein
MLLAGDEFGQTQHGNNNVYCQDSPVAWLEWKLSGEQRELLDFTRALLRLRRTQPVFRRRHFFLGRPIYGIDIKDLYWLKSDGEEMSETDWEMGHVLSLGMVLPGNQITEIDETGERIHGDSFAILFNAHHETIPFRLGVRRRDLRWNCILDTAITTTAARSFEHMSLFPLQARSLALLQGEPTKQT